MRQLLTLLLVLTFSLQGIGQSQLTNVKDKMYTTSTGLEIQGRVGNIEVLENRNDPNSRKITVKFIHLRSLSDTPGTPVLYLEGGSGYSTWQVEDPEELSYWVENLEVADMIFFDRRGLNDNSLNYLWKSEYPKDFWVSEEAATKHYQAMVAKALSKYEKKGVAIRSYHIESHAHDADELMTLLGFERYSLFGFSFGSHISMTMMKLFPHRIERAVLAGSDAPNQGLNFPSDLDRHVDKLSEMIAKDTTTSTLIPDLATLVDRVMNKLEANPAVVTVKHPITRKKLELPVGPFGLAVLLRLDIDDTDDIPVIPRLIYSIDKGDYSLLAWFLQKRLIYSIAVDGNGINQQLASGASAERWEQITKEAAASIFGNAVNFPFSAAKDVWEVTALSFDQHAPMQSDIPTLFVTGTLDCRTSVEQVEETKQGFSRAVHVTIENAGHDQTLWDSETNNDIIPAFFRGEEIKKTAMHYTDISFLPVVGPASGHPSLNN